MQDRVANAELVADNVGHDPLLPTLTATASFVGLDGRGAARDHLFRNIAPRSNERVGFVFAPQKAINSEADRQLLNDVVQLRDPNEDRNGGARQAESKDERAANGRAHRRGGSPVVSQPRLRRNIDGGDRSGSGRSKATLYAHYGSRDELFTAVIWGGRRPLFIRPGVGGAAPRIESRTLRPPGAVLDLLLSPDVVATNRIVAAEAPRFPELGKLFYENGPDRLIARLAEVFETAMAAGSLRRSVPRDVAKHFIGLIRGDLQLRAMLGDEFGMSSATERNRTIATGVGVFLAAYAPAEPFQER